MNTEEKALRLLGAAFLIVAIAGLISGLLLTSVVGPGNISDSLVNVSHQTITVSLSSIGELVTSSGIVALA